MTAEFDWWLLVLGLVIGAGLVWLILADLPRRDAEVDDTEVAIEAGWIAANLAVDRILVDRSTVEAVLHEHRAYLHLPPPDELAETPQPPGPTTAATEPLVPAAIAEPATHPATMEGAAPPPRTPEEAPGLPADPSVRPAGGVSSSSEADSRR